MDASNGAHETIKVAVRVRPPHGNESLQFSFEKDGAQQAIVAADSRKWNFDYVFNPLDGQKAVFDEAVSKVVESALCGFSGTVFAYGATSSGKTHTILGGFEVPPPPPGPERRSNELSERAGLLPRICNMLFDELKATDSIIQLSYLEIYNEELIDLMASTHMNNSNNETGRVALRIHSDSDGPGVKVIGLTEAAFSSRDDLLRTILACAEARQTASTLLNLRSSRSHTICTLDIKEKLSMRSAYLRRGRLTIVDLAGSENIERSGVAGTAGQREAGNINVSLVALGRVIGALNEGSAHVPYRDSKLTRLLQDSIGGSTRTLMIANITPTYDSETYNTLSYATQVRNICNRPMADSEYMRAMISQKEAEVASLQEKIESLSGSVERFQNLQPKLVELRAANVSNTQLLHSIKARMDEQRQAMTQERQTLLTLVQHEISELTRMTTESLNGLAAIAETAAAADSKAAQQSISTASASHLELFTQNLSDLTLKFAQEQSELLQKHFERVHSAILIQSVSEQTKTSLSVVKNLSGTSFKDDVSTGATAIISNIKAVQTTLQEKIELAFDGLLTKLETVQREEDKMKVVDTSDLDNPTLWQSPSRPMPKIPVLSRSVSKSQITTPRTAQRRNERRFRFRRLSARSRRQQAKAPKTIINRSFKKAWNKELDKVAASMKQAADDGRKRMPKSFYQKLDRLTRRSLLVNDDVKTGLAAALEAEFKVEKALGEADVYIGRVATDLDIVVSGDSDVFCYRNVKTMVRPTRHRGQYVFDVLDKSLALRKMKLSADDLVVLAVVSGNDYEGNIPGKAIMTNVKIFQKIKEKGDFSKEEMLKKYLLLCQSDRNFNVAKGGFFNCDEGNVLDPLDRSKGLEKRDKSRNMMKGPPT
ncbi:hypothetical protein SeMB42_g04193 [Synchytrium endobioticum]|uniref:Kinesin-like protein n=1 Tax=Synchytrium endobioticum TaxID=286115 RepID=A0A507D080_9FUNG|nr:hypothetical protein SeMB42_g04193 [Synchytrium endobioticum]